MNKLLLSFEDVSVYHQGQIILKDLNLKIRRGEHWAVVGPSGSGKSALLTTIAGKLPIARGQAEYASFEDGLGKNQGTSFDHHQRVSLVGSKHHFKNLSNTTEFYYQQRFNTSDSGDAPTVGGYLSSITDNASSRLWSYQKVTDTLKLRHLEDKELIKLSNGETKRLLIAAALIRNPLLLLLDNPFSGLDIESRESFGHLWSEIADSGIAIMMATSAVEIPKIITHIAVLENGKIIRKGLKEAFTTDALSSFVAYEPINQRELNELLSINPSPGYEEIVRMEEVYIKYGNKVVIDKVDWTVRQGEKWALLGHNGAGKSTLLSLINGDNPQAYANKITLFDRKRGSGESIWDIKSNIGFISPEFSQYFPGNFSCLHVIESGFYDTLGLFKPSDPEKTSIVRRWMRLLNFEQYAGKLFRNIPASVQRLCLLARALVKNPSLLILDEPCQGLDANQQQHFKHIVDEICANSNVTLIYVTHCHHEIPDSVTYTLRLEGGRVGGFAKKVKS